MRHPLLIGYGQPAFYVALFPMRLMVLVFAGILWMLQAKKTANWVLGPMGVINFREKNKCKF